jgi:hypothetical protein
MESGFLRKKNSKNTWYLLITGKKRVTGFLLREVRWWLIAPDMDYFDSYKAFS